MKKKSYKDIDIDNDNQNDNFSDTKKIEDFLSSSSSASTIPSAIRKYLLILRIA